MSRTSIIWTVVVIVVVAALGWYFLSRGSANQASSAANMATTTQATTTQSGASSGTQATTLKALTAQGGNYTCSIDTITSGGETTGTVYGAGGKTRLDLVVSQNGLTTTTHIIRSGTVSYTWVDGQQTGINSTVTPTTPITPASGGQIEVNDTTNLSSMCHPWVPDASQFTPPKGITFVGQ